MWIELYSFCIHDLIQSDLELLQFLELFKLHFMKCTLYKELKSIKVIYW